MDQSVKYDLWDHQKLLVNEAFKGMLKHGYHYWYSGCGTGKTLASLELVNQLAQIGKVSLVLVISVKATLKPVWQEDVQSLTPFDVTVLDKNSSKEKNLLMLETVREHRVKCQGVGNSVHVIVVNYETARLLDIDKAGFDMVIADEAHKLSQHNSKQSLELSKKCANIPFKLAMTGTAWADHIHQVYGQFRWLTPQLYANRNKHTGCKLLGHWNEFLDAFCDYYVRDNIKIIRGYKDVPQLVAKLSPHITRIIREDVIDLPPIHHIKRRFDLTPHLAKHYKAMQKEKVAHIDDKVAVAQFDMTQRHRLHQLTRGWFVDYPDANVTRIDNKQANIAVDTLSDLLDELGGEPTVIFTSYTEDVAILTEAINKRYGVTPAWLVGGTDEHSDFVQGRSNLLIANLQAGSTGVRLHRAKYIIFYGLSPSTSRTDYLQAIERVHRHGQENIVHCYHLIARGTVDEDAYKLLTRKANSEAKAEDMLQ